MIGIKMIRALCVSLVISLTFVVALIHSLGYHLPDNPHIEDNKLVAECCLCGADIGWVTGHTWIEEDPYDN